MHEVLWKPLTDILIPYETKEIRILNTIYSAYQNSTYRVGLKDFYVALLPGFTKEPPYDYQPEMEVVLSLQGDYQVNICFSNISFMEKIVGPNQDKLPINIRVLVAEFTLEAILVEFEKLIGCDVSISHVQFNPRQDRRIDRHHIPFQLVRQEDSASFEGYIALRYKELELLSSVLKHDTVSNGGIDVECLPIPLRMVVGRTHLLLRALKSLEPLDVIVMDEESISTGRVKICAGKRELWIGKIEEDKIVAEENAAEFLNDEPQIQNSINNEHVAFETDDLLIELEFEIGNSSMTLKEINSIQPGYVFKNLARLDQKTIKISANGKLIGIGDVVNIEKRIAVRLTEFV